jgi:hypothetical protein
VVAVSEYTTVIGDAVIRVNKIGGGIVGKKYEGDWEVTISVSATVVLDDVITTGTPKTHRDVAQLALDFTDDLLEV